MTEPYEPSQLVEPQLREIPGHVFALILSYLPNPLDGERAIVRSHFSRAPQTQIEDAIRAGNQDRRIWRVEQIKEAIQRSIRRG